MTFEKRKEPVLVFLGLSLIHVQLGNQKLKNTHVSRLIFRVDSWRITTSVMHLYSLDSSSSSRQSFLIIGKATILGAANCIHLEQPMTFIRH